MNGVFKSMGRGEYKRRGECAGAEATPYIGFSDTSWLVRMEGSPAARQGRITASPMGARGHEVALSHG